jgi:hypothetical protein
VPAEPAAGHPDHADIRAAVAERDRGRSRLRAVTAAIGAASVLAGGGIALTLPGAARAQSAQHASAVPSAGSGSSGSGSSSASGSGLQSGSAPSSGSGSGQVTSGGS